MRHTEKTLDDLLAQWHHWQDLERLAASRVGSPMFEDLPSPRGWDSASEIAEAVKYRMDMEAIEFAVAGDECGQGAMPEPHRSAIYALARNCHAGCSVWASPRLPADPMERGVVLIEAKNMLTRRLIAAEVLQASETA